MHSPTVAELLHGLIGPLRNEVLPELQPGAAQRQLKSALVLLRRLAVACERGPAYLTAEALDIEATLRAILDAGDPEADAILNDLNRIVDGGPTTDADALHERDRLLQSALIAAEELVRGRRDARALGELRRLHHRMLERQSAAWGSAA